MYFTRAETAEILRRKKTTLDRWAMRGYGPMYKRIGNRAMYDSSELIQWIERQTCDPRKHHQSKARPQGREG